jgi:uncharacterized membrane protein YciS (DUF1049 family)
LAADVSTLDTIIFAFGVFVAMMLAGGLFVTVQSLREVDKKQRQQADNRGKCHDYGASQAARR